MNLFRITGLLIEESADNESRSFNPRYGSRQATARWLGDTAPAREVVAACCRGPAVQTCTEC